MRGANRTGERRDALGRSTATTAARAESAAVGQPSKRTGPGRATWRQRSQVIWQRDRFVMR